MMLELLTGRLSYMVDDEAAMLIAPEEDDITISASLSQVNEYLSDLARGHKKETLWSVLARSEHRGCCLER